MAHIHISKQSDFVEGVKEELAHVDYAGRVRITFLEAGKHLGDSVMLQVEQGKKGTETGLWLETVELIEAIREDYGFAYNVGRAKRIASDDYVSSSRPPAAAFADDGLQQSASAAFHHMVAMRAQTAAVGCFLRDLADQIEADLPRYDRWIENKLKIGSEAVSNASVSLLSAWMR